MAIKLICFLSLVYAKNYLKPLKTFLKFSFFKWCCISKHVWYACCINIKNLLHTIFNLTLVNYNNFDFNVLIFLTNKARWWKQLSKIFCYLIFCTSAIFNLIYFWSTHYLLNLVNIFYLYTKKDRSYGDTLDRQSSW